MEIEDIQKFRAMLTVIEGHKRGVGTLEKVLDWCVDLGIEIVTAYAFSIENFNRPDKEVEGLMNTFQGKF